MNWHYKVLGSHTHVRVFMNGANCGKLCFRNEEFLEIYQRQTALTTAANTFSTAEVHDPTINFIEDGETQPATGCEATD